MARAWCASWITSMRQPRGAIARTSPSQSSRRRSPPLIAISMPREGSDQMTHAWWSHHEMPRRRTCLPPHILTPTSTHTRISHHPCSSIMLASTFMCCLCVTCVCSALQLAAVGTWHPSAGSGDKRGGHLSAPISTVHCFARNSVNGGGRHKRPNEAQAASRQGCHTGGDLG